MVDNGCDVVLKAILATQGWPQIAEVTLKCLKLNHFSYILVDSFVKC